jgi:hypothetical protein
MKDQDGMIQGFIAIVLMVFAAIIFCQAIIIDESDDLIRGCELSLPRTETCVLIAVPESAKDQS